MNALELLREDHRVVKDLFRQFEEAETAETKKGIVDTVIYELEMHTAVEEEIFYPSVRRMGGTTETVEHAEEEHKVAELLLDQLSRMSPDDREYDAKFEVLMDAVKEHIDDEESQMMPKAAEVGMDRLERLGLEMERFKETLAERMKRRAANGRSTNGSRTAAKSAANGRRTTAKSAATRAKTTASRAKTTARRGTSTTSGRKGGTRASGTRTRNRTGSGRSGSQSNRS